MEAHSGGERVKNSHSRGPLDKIEVNGCGTMNAAEGIYFGLTEVVGGYRFGDGALGVVEERNSKTPGWSESPGADKAKRRRR